MDRSVESAFLDAASAISGGHAAWLLGALLLIALHFVAEPLRWGVLFPGTTTIRVWLSLFNFTAFASYALPLKLGVPLRLLFLNLHARLTPSQIAAGMVADSACYYGVWGLCGSVGFIVTARRLLRPELPSLLWFAFAVLVGAGLVMLARKVKDRALASPWQKHATAALAVLTWHKLSMLVAIVILDVLSHILRHVVLVNLFGLNIAYSDVAALATAAILAGLLSFTPMGLGGYDAVLIAGLTQYGASVETATLVAVSNRVLTLLVAVVLGIPGAFVLRVNPFDLSGLRRMVTSRVNRRQK